jgi:hypothetical protein
MFGIVSEFCALRIGFGSLLGGIVLTLATVDVQKLILPNRLNLVLAAIGVSQSIVLGSPSPIDAAIGAGTADLPLRSFEVLKPFEVLSGLAAPGFGQVGLGIQYMTPVPLGTLIDRGIIREITP